MAKNPFKLEVVSVRLVKDAPILSTTKFTQPEDVVAVLGNIMCEFDREVMGVVNLKNDLTPINVHFASVGEINKTLAHPRELLKSTFLSNATSILLIHNHPSGQLLPSKNDTSMTDKMNQICELIGIPLLDHVIVAGDNKEFFSFKEKGLMKTPNIHLNTDYRNLSIGNEIVAEKGKGR